MPNRLSLIFVFLCLLGLSSCAVAPPGPEQTYPYGQPRYGHGGTQPPAPAGAPSTGAPNNAPYSAPGGPNVSGSQASQAGAPGGVTNPGVPGAGPGATPGANPAPNSAPNSAPNPGAGSAGATSSGGSSSEPPPYGIPVPGKNGMIYSPYKPDAGFIDITTRNADGSSSVLPPGTKIKDPFSGKPILVP